MGFWSWLFPKNDSENVNVASVAVVDRDIFMDDIRGIIRSYFDAHNPALFYAQLCGYRYETTNEDGYIRSVLSVPSDITQSGISFAVDMLQNKFEYMFFEHWEDTFRQYHNSVLTPSAQGDLIRAIGNYSKATFSKAFEEHRTEIASFAVNLVNSRRDIDIGNLKYKIEDKWNYLKPILRGSLRAGVDKYGEQDYDLFHKECKEFTGRFVPEGSLKFYDEILCWVEMSSIAMAKLEEEPVGSSREIPVDGVEFEIWCAERFIELGWDAQLTTATGDQGVDVIVRKDNLTVAVQCKRYSQPVGNKAVQEAYAGKQHIGADIACVIATAGFTKSAVELARSTLVYLVEADDIDIFAEHITKEIEA